MAQDSQSDREARWLECVGRWQQSGLSVRAFCQRQRLSEPSFYAWRRVLRQRGLLDEPPGEDGRTTTTGTTPAFVKVAVNAEAAAVPAIDLVVSEKRLLRVRPGFDPDLLRQLLRVLEEPSC